MSVGMYGVLVLALILANLPFMTTKLFGVIKLKHKHFAYQFLEWFVYYLVTGLFARLMESRLTDIHNQNWQFYVTTLCLFVVFAFPGFVLSYFWRGSVR